MRGLKEAILDGACGIDFDRSHVFVHIGLVWVAAWIVSAEERR